MIRIRRGVAVAGLTLASMLPSPTMAQVARTTFVPGLGASSNWWRRQGTIATLWSQVNLVDTLLLDPGTLSSVASQSGNVEAAFNATSGQHVLVGHSMGGVVIRRATILNPGHTAGILTTGTPHRGALIANNANVALSYVTSVIGAVYEGAAGVLGPGAGLIANISWNNVLQQNVKQILLSYLPATADATQDMKTTSAASVWNRDSWDNLPHVSLYGSIDRRFAWMRVASSAMTGTNAPVAGWQSNYHQAMNVFKKCKLLRFTIILGSTARKCGRAYNALASFDERWQFYTAGGNVASDGWVTNESSAYPGTYLSNATANVQVFNVDHNSLVTHFLAVTAMASAMKTRLGMGEP